MKSLKKIVLANGSVALKWEHPHGFMEEKTYLYKVEVNGETRFFPHEQRFRTKIVFQ